MTNLPQPLRAGLTEVTELSVQILALLYIRTSGEEIAKLLECSVDTVSAVKNSDFGREILAGMKTKTTEDAIDLRRKLEKIVEGNLGLAEEMIKGVVRQPVVNEEGEVSMSIRTITPEKRFDALVDTARLAGVGQQKPGDININIERLNEIKVRAKELRGVLAPAEDAEFTEE